MISLALELIRRRRRMIRTVTGRRPRRRQRLPRQLEPKLISASYSAALLHLLERARVLLQQRLVSRLPSIVAAARAARGDAARADAGAEDVNRILDEVAEAFYDGAEMNVRELERLAERYAFRTSQWQGEQLARQMRAALGVELPFQDRGFRQRVQEFTAENVALIKSIPQRFFDQVEQRVISGMREGLRWEDLAKTIEERFEVSRSSARLVARDQVGKFYGELQQTRQKELGVDGYIWRTVNDNRVREDHVEREGKRFTWNDPPEDGHPGIPINCRCYAEPDLSGILASL